MSDPRFSRLKTDPRFRRPKKHQAKVVVDERFKSVFDSQKSKGMKKAASARVDKYGRALAETHEEDNLKRFYRLENDKNEEGDIPGVPDYARGGVLMESSDEEENEVDEKGDSDEEGFVTVGQDASRPIHVGEVSDEEAEIDLDDNDDFTDLDAQAAAYSKTHPQPEASVDSAERTNRLAIVNLDWEHVRAAHLFKICSSLVSPTAPAVAPSRSKPGVGKKPTKGTTVARGRVLNVKVYRSEFGKKRMAREEKEGPPPELFRRKGHADDEEVNERNIYEVGGGDDFDEDALRKYQLERLRYYYAIVTCDTVDAASHIYNELEGTELERSANMFDLSFVPNGMSFDDEPRDEATEDVETGYKAVEFVTDALRHSKVKLTWDEDDPERNKVTRRNITKKEIDDADFQAYIASASSESEDEDADTGNRKGLARDKLRSLLLGGNDELPEGWDKGNERADDIDMEVTFTPGLGDVKDEEETTLEKYQRKMREKRKKRKEGAKEKAETQPEDDFFDAASDGDEVKRPTRTKGKSSPEPSDMEDLSAVVPPGNDATEPQHFNLKSIMKAERKIKNKKRRKGKKTTEEDNEMQEDFAIDVKDDRFKAIHDDHNFAIDPSHPQFKKTKAMESLLNERSHRKTSNDKPKATSSQSDSQSDLKNLAERVKRKGGAALQSGKGKRQRLQ
ncbi:pre-rRNA-processing protein esf1 [Marasmius tenuissimus]|uniref:Pre-rRNA-processing protein esf1 n=1 Tax=Marasmius tenuissimus TaxID=585030 RepID=A0ABR3AEX6_9AGAR